MNSLDRKKAIPILLGDTDRFLIISLILKSPSHEPILICSDGYLLGKNTLFSSSKDSFPPDCVNR